MMDNGISRRRWLQAWSGFVSFVLLGPRLLGGRPAEAQAKATREQVKYQDTPKGKQDCSNCLQFIAPDQCKLVAGKINPKGWCLLYAAKPAK
jgi:High potential iron-sulfur protein